MHYVIVTLLFSLAHDLNQTQKLKINFTFGLDSDATYII